MTTVTFNPETGNGTNANDKSWYSGWSFTWATTRGGTGFSSSYSNSTAATTVYGPGLRAGFGLGYALGRANFNFYYTVPTGATVTAVTLKLYTADKGDDINDSDSFIRVVPFTGAATGYADAEWSNVGTTAWSADFDITGLAAIDSQNSFALNSTGISQIIVDGANHALKLGMAEGHDINNTGGSISTGGSLNEFFSPYMADNATKIPALDITYTTPNTKKGNFFAFM